jgi:hypothetical protein
VNEQATSGGPGSDARTAAAAAVAAVVSSGRWHAGLVHAALNAMLADQLGNGARDARYELSLLTQAAVCGIPAALEAGGDTTAATTELATFGFDEDETAWAAAAWRAALGIESTAPAEPTDRATAVRTDDVTVADPTGGDEVGQGGAPKRRPPFVVAGGALVVVVVVVCAAVILVRPKPGTGGGSPPNGTAAAGSPGTRADAGRYGSVPAGTKLLYGACTSSADATTWTSAPSPCPAAATITAGSSAGWFSAPAELTGSNYTAVYTAPPAGDWAPLSVTGTVTAAAGSDQTWLVALTQGDQHGMLYQSTGGHEFAPAAVSVDSSANKTNGEKPPTNVDIWGITAAGDDFYWVTGAWVTKLAAKDVNGTGVAHLVPGIHPGLLTIAVASDETALAAGLNGNIVRSDASLENWTPVASPAGTESATFDTVAWSDGVWYLGDKTGAVWSSSDLTTWSTVAVPTLSQARLAAAPG